MDRRRVLAGDGQHGEDRNGRLQLRRDAFSRLRANAKAGLEPLQCRDGYVYVLWAADAHFEALKELLGNPEALEATFSRTPRSAPSMTTSCVR